MMIETVPTYKRWREDVERWMERGEKCEAIAVQHSEIPFRICPIIGQLNWFEHNEDIQTFSARVRQVAAIFGTPTKVNTEGSNRENAPDMRAQWKLEGGITVELRAFAPQCRTHPQSHYVAGTHIDAQYPAIHPECADVLKELEDYEPETVAVLTDNP